MSYTIAVIVDLGPESSGATVHGQLYDNTGIVSGSAITSGIVELAATGFFQHVATLADGFVGALVLYEAATPTNRAAVSINPQETENADVKISTRATATEVATELTTYDAPTKAELDAAQAAIVAATGATETALVAAIDIVPTAAEIDTQLSGTHGATSWITADISALYATPVAEGPQLNIAGALTMVRASTFVATLSFLSIPADWTEAILTVKLGDNLTDSDSDAIIQITESAGLVWLNGLAATAGQASLTVDQPNGTVAIRIEDDATAQIEPNNYAYDVKFFHGSSASVAYDGRLKVVTTATQTV